MTAVDPDFQRHYRTWIAFTWFIKIGLFAIIFILAGMALFLL